MQIIAYCKDVFSSEVAGFVSFCIAFYSLAFFEQVAIYLLEFNALMFTNTLMLYSACDDLGGNQAFLQLGLYPSMESEPPVGVKVI